MFQQTRSKLASFILISPRQVRPSGSGSHKRAKSFSFSGRSGTFDGFVLSLLGEVLTVARSQKWVIFMKITGFPREMIHRLEITEVS